MSHYLTFTKEEGARPIAIVKHKKNEHHALNERILYLVEHDSDSDSEEGEIVVDKSRLTIDPKKPIDKTATMAARVMKGAGAGGSVVGSGQSIKKILESKGRSIEIPSQFVFELLPKFPSKSSNTRDTLFLSGASGCGKSYAMKQFAENYDIIHGGKNKIYLISMLDTDATLDRADCVINRLNLQSLVDDPININSGEIDNSLILFDDIDPLLDGSDKGMKEALLKLMNDILTTGRHTNTSMMFASHAGANGRNTKYVLAESDYWILYPKGGTSPYNMEYLLKNKLGLSKSQIEEITRSGKTVALHKGIPMFLIGPNTVKLI